VTIIAYHHPAAGADPAPAVLVELAELEAIVGFKDSSRDITRIAWLADRIDRAGHARYFTTMQPLLTTLLLGGAGAMMPPPATRVAARVVAAVRAGDLRGAAREQRAFATFPGPWSRYGLTPLMKRAMAHCGIELGTAPTSTPELPAALEEAIADFVREHVRPEPPTVP
jgi:4-hydroxy-tetrahydrodipicolinate synthase